MICYPREASGCEELVEDLLGFGFDLERLSFYKKGTDSVVLLNELAGTLVKVARLDSNAEIAKEGLLLLRLAYAAPELRLAPRALAFSKKFLHMERVSGPTLAELLESGRRLGLRHACELLARALALDLLGVDHGELSRPYKHVVFAEPGEEPVFLDFGRASISRRPRNFSCIASFLLRKSLLEESAAEALLKALEKLGFSELEAFLRQQKANKKLPADFLTEACEGLLSPPALALLSRGQLLGAAEQPPP